MPKSKSKPKRTRRVDYVKPGHKLQTPKSSVDWRAWYMRDKETGNCPRGTHPAPGYDRIHGHKRWCVRNCDMWEPERETSKKDGTCRRQSAWMALLADMRGAARAQMNQLQGAEKSKFLMDLTKEASEIYNAELGKGATMQQYMANRDRIMAMVH